MYLYVHMHTHTYMYVYNLVINLMNSVAEGREYSTCTFLYLAHRTLPASPLLPKQNKNFSGNITFPWGRSEDADIGESPKQLIQITLQ